MSFRIEALDPSRFAPLFDLSDAELVARGARRVFADSKPGFPCRVSFQDAEVGEELLLVNYEHQPAPTPYRASHAVYVRRAATEAASSADALPTFLEDRLLSIRAFDADGMLRDADVGQGEQALATLESFIARPEIDEVHLHSARMGCYLAKAVRD
jgi:hypothetical protein